MTHKRLKNYLKFGILFFIISLLNLGCQKDESLEPNEQVQEQNSFTINHINSNQISNNTKLALSLERLNAAKTKSNTENRTAHSEEHNFYIDTERAVYIESQDGSYHSYTFLVQRNDEQTGLENLLLSLQEDGSYTAKLIKYNFEFYGTDGFLEALSNNHNNVHITPIDADGLTASLFARTTTSGVCFFITETSCSYGNHSGGYYANGNQCPGHHSHTRMECLGGGGQSGNSGTGDGSATTGSGETDSTTGGSGSTNGGILGGNNNNDFTLPLTLSMAEQLSSFIDLTPEQEVWANKPQNEDSVKLMISILLTYDGNTEFMTEAIENVNEIINSDLDGTLITAFPFFKYPEGTNYANIYPELTWLLQEHIPSLKNNTHLINTITSLTGISEEEAKSHLTWDNGPEVHITDLGFAPDGTAYKGKFNPSEPNKIYIDIDLVEYIEQYAVVNGETTTLAALRSLLIFGVCLHELVHFADFDFDGLMQDNVNLELGELFEQIAISGHYEFNPNGEVIFMKIDD